MSSLGHFYDQHRQVSAGVPLGSVIYAQHRDDIFADSNGRFLLHVEVADTFSAADYGLLRGSCEVVQLRWTV